ncbi:hypothetical protein NBG4_530012 [Candidatus Sulfobium mesophilum]|uniref:PatA-like N-terminal domain-containing protein n=1 Tax=Candidatus Sulfobium mesophilum TaxID=2016548 RepID=A0A2U3QJ23_9BACT|nr:hypothetical protein NBG4_530012 [Candidatus Sulfobium mesophilum]
MLSRPVGEIDIVQLSDSSAAFDIVKRRRPDIIVIDIEPFGLEAFREFYQVARKTFCSEAHFLVLATQDDHVDNLPSDICLMVKPFSADQLITQMRNILFESPSAVGNNGAGLLGKLADFDLHDIIQILNLGLKTAKVEITRGEEKGTLYLSKGKLVHASLGSTMGREAFFELMRWKEGNFSIVHGQRTNNVNIKSDTMWLVLEAARAMDELEMDQKLTAEET